MGIKIRCDGSIVWQKVYGGNNNDVTWDLIETSDGGIVVTGYTVSAGVGSDDYWVLKLDSDGYILFRPTADVVTLDTAATVTNSTVTPEDSTITPLDSNAIIGSQAP